MNKEIVKNNVVVRIFPSRAEMGQDAAREAARRIRRLLAGKSEVNILFASAPSQNELLEALVAEEGIEWERVNAFHMDEYIGLAPEAPQGFGNYLKHKIFDRKNFKSVHYMAGISDDPRTTCAEYARLLREHPLDFGFFGIGENGHLAFNDPHVARFDDPETVKTVDLDAKCRMQQVNDGCFARLEDVPVYAITLTMPVLTAIPQIFCTVPGAQKANAVRRALCGGVATDCPASVLQRHGDTTIYLDAESASLLES